MGNDKNSNPTPQSNLPVGKVVPVALAPPVSPNAGPEPQAQGLQAPVRGESARDVPVTLLSDAQFARLERVLVLAAIAAGVVFNAPKTTPSPANLGNIKALGDAVLELAQ